LGCHFERGTNEKSVNFARDLSRLHLTDRDDSEAQRHKFKIMENLGNKTNEELLKEIDLLKERILELEKFKIKSEQAELALKESEEKFKILVTNSEGIVYIIGRDGTFLLSEGRGLTAIGLKPGQVVGESVFELYKDSPEMLDEMRRTFNGETINNEVKIGDIYFRNWYTPQKNDKGEIVGLLGLSVNATEQILDKQTAVKEKNKAQQYLDIVDVMLVSVDSDGIVKLINPKGCEILGYSEEEILRKNWFDNFLPERYREDVKEVAKKVFAGEMESVKYYENEILTKSGNEKLIAWHNAVYKDANGKVIGTISSGEDITERKKSEEKIQRFNRIFKDSLNEIFLFNSETYLFTQANSAAQKNLGYSMEELLEMTPLDFIPEFTAKSFTKLVKPLHNKEKQKIVLETVHQRKDKSLYNAEVHLQLLHFENENIFAAIILDVTERKKDEKVLLQSLQREQIQADIVRRAPISIAFGYPDGRLENCNKAFADLTGYSEKELKTISWNEVLTPPKWNDIVAKELQKLSYNNHVIQYEQEFIHKSGTIIPIELVFTAKFDEENNLLHFIGFITDITERKLVEDELEKHREHLEELVKERTVELEEKNKKLDNAMKVFVGRELTIRDLQNKIKALKGK